MLTLKDKRKFGKGKIPKNRRCKKFGYSWGSKELRKSLRKAEAKRRDNELHHRYSIINAY